MRLTRDKLKTIILVPIVVLLLFFLTVGTDVVNRSRFAVLLTFFLNGIIWSILLIKEINRRAFSISFVHWFFCLFFFFFAGITEYFRDIFPRKGLFTDQLILKANIILFAWTLLYCLGVHFARLKSNKNKSPLVTKSISRKNASQNASYFGFRTFILFFLSIAILIWKIYSQGFVNLFISARATSTFEISDNSSISVLVDKITMAISFFAVIFSYDYWRKKGGSPLFFISSLISLFVSFFPLVISRNTAAGLYLGVALYIAFSFFGKGRKFFVFYLLAFVIAFPLLNSFRYGNITTVSIGETISNLFQNFKNEWLASDYDAYSMLLTTIRYIEENGIVFGKQLIGVFLFWIPRSIWVNKPVATGEYLGAFYRWDFINVSEPLVGEILINFGLIGIFVLGPFVGYLIEITDNSFWCNPPSGKSSSKIAFLYPFVVAYVLFVFRGALLSAFAYLCAVVFVWFIFSSQPFRLVKRR